MMIQRSAWNLNMLLRFCLDKEAYEEFDGEGELFCQGVSLQK